MRKIDIEKQPTEIPVVILSHNRADKVHSFNAVANAYVCVEESQKSEYAKYIPEDRIITHPDIIRGLPPKREWLFKKFDTVFSIDDDIVCFFRALSREGKALSPEEAYCHIQNLYQLSLDLDSHLFGIRVPINAVTYDGFQPYTYQAGHPAGTFCGVIDYKNSGLYNFDDTTFLAEDMFIALLNLYKHRYFVTDCRVSARIANQSKNNGGLQDIRNYQNEKKAYRILKEHFGDSIGLVVRNKKKLAFSSQKQYFNRCISIKRS